MIFKLLRDDYLKLNYFYYFFKIFLKVEIYKFMIFIFNYCYIVYLLLRSVNLLSIVCETYLFIFIYYGVIKTLYNLFSFQMTNHRKYRFHRTDTGQYRHRYRTEVRYRFRFSQKTGTDTGTGEPYVYPSREDRMRGETRETSTKRRRHCW